MSDRSRGGFASRGRGRGANSTREDAPRGYGGSDEGQGRHHGDWWWSKAPGREPDDRKETGSWRRGGATAAATASPPRQEEDEDELSGKLDALKITEIVRGECEAMCASDEVKMRLLTKDVSRFEIAPGAANKTELPWAVKKYRRPAAGRIEIQPQELRPPHVLEQTLLHLFGNVLPRSGCGFDWSSSGSEAETKPQDFLALYHFLSDRVRSVRQDFVIQRITGLQRIQAQMQIARFYVLASFRATQILDFGDKTLDWSETLNDQQLASALTEVQAQFQSLDSSAVETNETMSRLREEALAFDVLLHLPDARAVSLLLVKTSPTRSLKGPVLALFIAFQTGDFLAFAQCYRQLSVLQQCLALRHLAFVWPRFLAMMNKAYGKIDHFTLTEIADSLALSSPEDARTVCKAMNVHVEDAVPVPLPPPAPSAVDSWEEATSVEAAPPRAESFVQFKISAMRDELEKPVEWELLRHKAASIQRKFTSSATELVVATTAS